jgi:hypothetical protein
MFSLLSWHRTIQASRGIVAVLNGLLLLYGAQMELKPIVVLPSSEPSPHATDVNIFSRASRINEVVYH